MVFVFFTPSPGFRMLQIPWIFCSTFIAALWPASKIMRFFYNAGILEPARDSVIFNDFKYIQHILFRGHVVVSIILGFIIVTGTIYIDLNYHIYMTGSEGIQEFYSVYNSFLGLGTYTPLIGTCLICFISGITWGSLESFLKLEGNSQENKDGLDACNLGKHLIINGFILCIVVAIMVYSVPRMGYVFFRYGLFVIIAIIIVAIWGIVIWFGFSDSMRKLFDAIARIFQQNH